MLDRNGLSTLLGTGAEPGSPVITIYSEYIPERLKYTSAFIFNSVLNVQYRITNDLENFTKASGGKINYSTQSLHGQLQIIPHHLIFESGVSSVRPKSISKNNMLYFYENSIGFHIDIFSAVFYFISRYEEWQHFNSDSHGRFEAPESILYSQGMLQSPVVDKWIGDLKNALMAKFPSIVFPEKKFKVLSTIDVDNLYAYRFKGLLRTAGAFAKDLIRLDLKNFQRRRLVIAGKQKDPFDIYEEISDFCFMNRIPLFWFFLFSTKSRHDRTVNPESTAYKSVFEMLKKNKTFIGIHPSYNTVNDERLLNSQIQKLSKAAAQPILFSRQHYLRFDIRRTPQMLLNAGIQADFTMGFASAIGFRAGTSFPFYYYDLENEKATDLLFIPFSAMDGAFTVYNKTNHEEAYTSLHNLAMEIKKSHGIFITVFHERSFSDHLYEGFGSLYKKLITELKE